MSQSRHSVIRHVAWALICLIGPLAAHAQQRPPLLLRLLFTDGRGSPPAAAAPGVDAASVPALTTPPARRLTTSYLGRPIDTALIADIQNGLSAYFGQIGRPFVEISIPAQNIAAGTLLVQIRQATIGAIRVEGNQWFDAGQYVGAIRDRPGDPIDTNRLFADVAWINRNSSRQVKLLIGPGQQPGTYDLTLRATDQLPLNVTLAADNTGTNETGLYRLGVDFDWSNALWRGDDMNYDFVASPDGSGLREHILSYTAYLPWRDTLTLVGAHADTNAIEATGSSTQAGTVNIASLRYGIPLPGSAAFTHRIDFGYDFKTSNTNALSGGSQVFTSTSEIDQFVLDYSLQHSDRWGVTALTITLVGSPGGLSPGNTPGAFASQQADASPNYTYGRLSAERLTNLVFGTAWDVRLTAQYSSANLLPSEQLIFGGVQSIRGFVEQGALRDAGVVVQNELRGPPIRSVLPDVLQDSGDAQAGDIRGIVPFAFLDLGAGRNHFDIAGNRASWVELVSIGPGVTLPLFHRGSVRLSWGFPLVRTGRTGPLLGPQFGIQVAF